MEQQPPPPEKRPFQPVSVGTCHLQTATDRFGHEGKLAISNRERVALGEEPLGPHVPFTWPGQDSDDDEGTTISSRVPTSQRFRNNLTALAQSYNLYLVAYQGRIFVYVPRSVPAQTLPTDPALQLRPKPSKAAHTIGGYIDRDYPHIVNQLIVGFLGQQEIVVACFDNGDVVAYYIKDIVEAVFLKQTAANEASTASADAHDATARRRTPAPFLHENVGVSAWGLAVHQKSRLIAVSSNRKEVTIFAPALRKGPQKFRDSSGHCNCCKSLPSTVSQVRGRRWNWRIVVLLGAGASNIPCVSFIDDEDGFAERICAADINGGTWFADIWTKSQPVFCLSISDYKHFRSEASWPETSMGWCAIVLPEKFFVTVGSVEEMFGAPVDTLEILKPTIYCRQPMANVFKCVKGIPGNPCCLLPLPAEQYHRGNRVPDMALEPESGEDEDTGELDGGDDAQEEEEAEVDTEDETPAMSTSTLGQVLLDSDVAFQDFTATVDGYEELFSNGSTASTTSTETKRALDHANRNRQALSPGMSDSVCSCHECCCKQKSLNFTPPRSDMVYFPHNGQVQAMPQSITPLLAFLRRPLATNANVVKLHQHDEGEARLGKRYHIFHGYEKDLEMRSLGQKTEAESELEQGDLEDMSSHVKRSNSDNLEGGTHGKENSGTAKPKKERVKEVGVLCPNVLLHGYFQMQMGRQFARSFQGTSRMNMWAHIPELSLVIVGSAIGRVLLITPTRLASPVKHGDVDGVFQHGFRVEWVLPSQQDEEAYRRPKRSLHGMAVGPVQDHEHAISGGVAQELMPKRYRLMLHYRNHDILTYELTRIEQTGKVCIF